jgi:riboflavin transporter FmnP
MTVAVALLELVTVSDTGLIGLLMNVLSTTFFVVPAAYVYSRRKTLGNAIVGLSIGALLMTGAMMLWNWLITPLYMHVPREAVVEMLLPIFLPFNLFKAALNAVLTTVLYKSVVSALRKAKLVPQSMHESNAKRGIGVWLVGLTLLAALVLTLLVWKGIL